MNQLFLVGHMVDYYDLVEYRRQWLIIGCPLLIALTVVFVIGYSHCVLLLWQLIR